MLHAVPPVVQAALHRDPNRQCRRHHHPGAGAGHLYSSSDLLCVCFISLFANSKKFVFLDLVHLQIYQKWRLTCFCFNPLMVLEANKLVQFKCLQQIQQLTTGMRPLRPETIPPRVRPRDMWPKAMHRKILRGS